MRVKLDTKEKFHVITLLETELTVNMTGDLDRTFRNCTQNPVKNIIVNLEQVTKMEPEAAQALCMLQQQSYEQNHSMVFCCIAKELENWLDEQELLELMNVTPTESEAMDIIQMEEIERELFGE